MRSNHSIGAAGEATRTCMVMAATVKSISDAIDMKGGIQAKAQAGKHLSELLMAQIDQMLGFSEGKAGKLPETRDFNFYNRQIEALQWLVAEVWETCNDLAGQIDDLNGGVVELSNAEYDTRPSTKAQARAAA